MIDSTNPRQLADNIRKLWDKFKSISGDLLPSRSTATTGQILKLTGENKTPSWADEYSYTPPAYSETEVNTGQKWIDGKDIYFIVLDGQFPGITQTTNIKVGELPNINLLYCIGTLISSTTLYNGGNVSINYTLSNGNVYFASVTTAFSEKYYKCIIYYTKPDPAPETRDDDTPEEPEEKKTTRKKTTK